MFNTGNKQKNETIEKSNSSLQYSIVSVLMLAQSFALMPVLNITTFNVNNLKCEWLSLRMFYTLFNLIAAITLVAINFYRYLNTGMHLGDMVTITYFSITTLTIFLFIRIAFRWKELSKTWLSVEIAMKRYKYKPNLKKRFHITTFFVMIFALGEHILFITKIVYLINECDSFKRNPVKAYFSAAFAPIFDLISYSDVKVFVLEYTNILATFAWNFMDLFIMILCAAMAEKFRQINREVKITKIRDEPFWKTIREDYNRVAALCHCLDKTINHLVSVSFFNNLFFICIQLFRTLEPIKGPIIHFVYFFGSFGFLLGRTIAVSVYASWINDESKVILDALFDVPSEMFGIEANRLIKQVSSNPVAITGSNYFEVTRDLCLKVGGAIITFELILQQVGPMLFNIGDGENKPFCIEFN